MTVPSWIKSSLSAFGIFWGMPIAVIFALSAFPLMVIYVVPPSLYEVKMLSEKPNGQPVEVQLPTLPVIRLRVPADYLISDGNTKSGIPLKIHYGFPSMESAPLASKMPWWRKSKVVKPPLEDRSYLLGAYLFNSDGQEPETVVLRMLKDNSQSAKQLETYQTRLLSFKPEDLGLTTYRFNQPGARWQDPMRLLTGANEERAWEFIHVPKSRRDLFIQCFDTHMGLGLFPSCEVVTNILIHGQSVDLRYTIQDYLIPYWSEYDRRLRALLDSFAK
jgi:hypothetical protein